MIGETFLDNPKRNPIIDHINGIRTDNRIVNLRWVTKRENNNNLHFRGAN